MRGGRLVIKINTSKVTTGMTLSRAIYDNDGKLLLEKGIILKTLYIEQLKRYKIENIYIYDDNKRDKKFIPTEVELASEETEARILTMVKDAWNDLQISKNINIPQVEKAVMEIIEDIIKKKVFVLNLAGIKDIDKYTFGHSINVCILSLVMGIALDYSKDDLKNLGIGALLHDIGKIRISEKILNKPDVLTESEYEEIKKHSLFGYDMVKHIKDIHEDSALIIRDHHERYDGKGYPNGREKSNIHIFPGVVAICDVYDALTSNRVYRKGVPPHQAIEYLISMGNHQFDYELIRVFLKQICIYPTGTLVRLATGEEAVVIKNYEDWPTRPVVAVSKDVCGNVLNKVIKIDLTRNPSNSIIGILEAI